MTKTYNLAVPPTLLRIGENDVDKLALVGLDRDVDRNDVQKLMDQRYPERKRAANSLVKLVSDVDISIFNDSLLYLRECGLTTASKMTITSSYGRGMLTIRLL